MTAAGVGTGGAVTISGLELRLTAAKTAITGDGTEDIVLSGVLTGDTYSTTNIHPFDHASGVRASYTVVTQNAGTEVAGTAFSVTVTAVDQHGNTNDDGANLITGRCCVMDGGRGRAGAPRLAVRALAGRASGLWGDRPIREPAY